VNVDLCFVPATHAVDGIVPAVSGSSGRLVVQRRVPVGERTWPGRVFEQSELSYAEAMEHFVAARQAAQAAKRPLPRGTKLAFAATEGKVERQARRSAAQRLQVSRREERARRQLRDRRWQEQGREHRARVAAVQEARLAGRPGWKLQAGVLKAHWRAAWAERHREYAQRRADDARWWEERQAVRPRADTVGPAMAWIAILVIVDNCTRRCVGVPLFTLGVHVTADLVVAALRALLPRELAYLIADGGTHFAGTALAELTRAHGFVRVPLAIHRPQSNGIAERFVETLKSWLARQPWETPEELSPLLAAFLAYYNDRPHQGAELAGLSPNEYAARMAVV
jgi:transposase InsO family protein